MTSNYRTQTPLVISLFIAVIIITNTIDAAQVPIAPSPSLDQLVDDPLDPNDDPDAFLLTPSGNFRIESFSYNAVPAGDFVPQPEDVFVTLREEADRVTLLFQITGKNLAVGPEAFDIELEYDVTATDELSFVTGHTLFMNGRGLGDGSVVINDEILNSNDDLIATLTTRSNVEGMPDDVVESVQFPGTHRITTQNKGIAVVGGTQQGQGVGFLSHFEQTFQFGRVPEPASVVLMLLAGGMGLAVVAATRRTT